MKQMLAAMVLCWTVAVSPGRAVDGDTVTVTAHIWLGLSAQETVRLLGVNTPERGQPGYEEAKLFTREWLGKGEATLSACKRDSFGRALGRLQRGGEDLTDLLIQGKHGVPR